MHNGCLLGCWWVLLSAPPCLIMFKTTQRSSLVGLRSKGASRVSQSGDEGAHVAERSAWVQDGRASPAAAVCP
jgi:hypothetical protein